MIIQQIGKMYKILCSVLRAGHVFLITRKWLFSVVRLTEEKIIGEYTSTKYIYKQWNCK